MKTETSNRVLLGALLFTASQVIVHAQQYSINWFAIGGGGGTSTNSQYILSGTIGQPFAGGTLTDGNYSLTGGFWSLFAIQTPGAPVLTIVLTSTNTVVVAWPAPSAGFVLQQSSDLGTPNWVNATNSVSVLGGQNQIVVSSPTGNLFYRLFHP